MGLLSHITAEESRVSSPRETKHRGLLSLSSSILTAEQCKTLADFSRIFYRPHCAFFSLIDGKFIMSECIGFDAITVAKSISSYDFWNGTLATSTGFTVFSNSGIVPFRQFFSENYSTKIVTLRFLRISESLIFMAADLVGEKQEQLSSTDTFPILRTLAPSTANFCSAPVLLDHFVFPDSCNAYLLLVSVKLAVHSIIKNFGTYSSAQHTAAFNAIYTMMCRELSVHFLSPNFFCSSTDGEMKLVVFSHADVDDTLIQFHVSRLFSSVLGTDTSSSVIVLLAGQSSDSAGILSFLNEG